MKITEFEIGKKYCLACEHIYGNYTLVTEETRFSLEQIMCDDWEEYIPKIYQYERIKQHLEYCDQTVREAILDIINLDLEGRVLSFQEKQDLRLEKVKTTCQQMCKNDIPVLLHGQMFIDFSNRILGILEGKED